ncbi:hypothetical protein FKM82_024924 [Ascaphus truei]
MSYTRAPNEDSARCTDLLGIRCFFVEGCQYPDYRIIKLLIYSIFGLLPTVHAFTLIFIQYYPLFILFYIICGHKYFQLAIYTH